MPNLFLIAGPNGAGKSTSAPELLTGIRKVAEFVNADVTQQEGGISEIEAGRITLTRLDALAAARKDLAFETTLASRLLLPRIHAMQAAGYAFHLTFFWLPSADMAVARVAKRVASGGHSIPEDVIRRRYERGLDNFFNTYSPAADSWLMVNNTSAPGTPIAWREVGASTRVLDNPLWSQLVSRYLRPRAEQPPAAVLSDSAIERLRRTFDPRDIMDAVNRAVADALRRHKALGQSVVIWRDGKIVTLRPEEIEI